MDGLSRRSRELGWKQTWRIDGGLMIGEEDRECATSGNFEDVPQTEARERKTEVKTRGCGSGQ